MSSAVCIAWSTSWYSKSFISPFFFNGPLPKIIPFRKRLFPLSAILHRAATVEESIPPERPTTMPSSDCFEYPDIFSRHSTTELLSLSKRLSGNAIFAGLIAALKLTSPFFGRGNHIPISRGNSDSKRDRFSMTATSLLFCSVVNVLKFPTRDLRGGKKRGGGRGK